MTVFITGVAGFIGYYLARRLLEEGNTIVGIDNLNDYYSVDLKKSRLEILKEFPRFTFVEGDLVDADLLKTIFEKNVPDIVVNLAAQAGVRYSIENPDAYIQSNIVGFFRILECCRDFPVKHLVYASSSSVYGENTKIPFSVADCVDKPVSLYAATKKADELMAYSYCKLYSIPCTGLRFFTVYGPMGRPDMAYFSFAEKIMKDEPIKIFNNGDMYRDFTYIDDVVEAVCRIIAVPMQCSGKLPYKIYNIGNNRPEKLMTFIETLENALGKKAIKEYYPMQPGDVYQTYADISELYHDFGFKPETGIVDGLNHFAVWFRKYYAW